MEDVQTRIQYAVGKMISTLDKEVLRKLQVIFLLFFCGGRVVHGVPRDFGKVGASARLAVWP